MILLVAISITIITLTKSATRFVVDVYSTPLATLHQAYPLDICVNVEAGFTEVYGIYTCNTDKTGVSLTTYGDDRTCTDKTQEEEFVTEIEYDDSKTSGELGTFNCDGEDNYVVTRSYQDDDTCCGGDDDVKPTFVTAATGVCFENNFDDDEVMYQYARASCNVDGGWQYGYNGDGYWCNNMTATRSTDPTYSYPIDDCEFYIETFGISVYLHMDKCIEDGVAIVKSYFCGDRVSSTIWMSTTGDGDDAVMLDYRVGVFIIGLLFMFYVN